MDWLNSNTLFASLVRSSVGLGLFIYGKKQGVMTPLIGGIAMMAVSYLVPNALLMSLICLLIIGGVWLLVRRGD
jgi:hypothetical protein